MDAKDTLSEKKDERFKTEHTCSELAAIAKWAKENILKGNKVNEYALGVLATLNYLTWHDKKTPVERENDAWGIIESLYTPEWVKIYLERHGLPEQY